MKGTIIICVTITKNTKKQQKNMSRIKEQRYMDLQKLKENKSKERERKKEKKRNKNKSSVHKTKQFLEIP